MKKSMLPTVSIAALAFALTATMSACGQPASGSAEDSAKVPTIGISTIVSHPDLDALIDGIKDGLEEQGYVEGEDVNVEVQNAQGNISLTTTIAQKFVEDKVDVIVGVSTPSSQAAVKATENSSIPVVFSGVSADPSSAGLAKPGNESLGRLVTGVYTPDTIEDQLDLFAELTPSLERLGFLYNPGEPNSVQSRDLVEAAAKKRGWTIVDGTVASSNYVSTAMDALVGKVDAVLLPQDNTVMTGLQTLIKTASEKKLPLYTSDTSSVEDGALATVATNTYEQGKQTATMIAGILQGKSANDITPEPAGQVTTWVNTTAADSMGVTVPASILNSAQIAK
ncbi:ABC transporter substrate-binding protein [Arthrobacter sp. NPDC089319]|uniref:ABC transporter substrate-binding protein n=1 Tax=Arthrobacter sp. NPDC089319 TaxID=3155915 RepID=UPI003415BA9F